MINKIVTCFMIKFYCFEIFFKNHGSTFSLFIVGVDKLIFIGLAFNANFIFICINVLNNGVALGSNTELAANLSLLLAYLSCITSFSEITIYAFVLVLVLDAGKCC